MYICCICESNAIFAISKNCSIKENYLRIRELQKTGSIAKERIASVSFVDTEDKYKRADNSKRKARRRAETRASRSGLFGILRKHMNVSVTACYW